MDCFQTKKKIIRQQQIKKHIRKKQRFCSIYSTVIYFRTNTRFVVGGSWYDRSHHYPTPKTINSRVAESEVKYPNSDFPKCPTPTPWHKGNEIWLLKSMKIVVHSKKSLTQQKFQKKLYHFNRNSNLEVWYKKWSSWASGIGVGQKNPTPTPSVVRNPTPPKNLRLRNPD